MSRPRFLADHDLTEAIVLGTLRREPAIEFRRIRDAGRAHLSDPDVLAYAAMEGLLIVSHDVNSMTAHAGARLAAASPLPGLFLVHQGDPVSLVIEDLILIWSGSEFEEWANQIVFLPISRRAV